MATARKAAQARRPAFCRPIRRAPNPLTRFLEDGDLEIDNGATERANRDIAFFGSDEGGKAAVVQARDQM